MDNLAPHLAMAFPFAANLLEQYVMPHKVLLRKVLRLRLHHRCDAHDPRYNLSKGVDALFLDAL